MASPLKVVAIMGPTASGKSVWALKLAKEFNGVIISADSRQIYKGLDVATAKVAAKEREAVPHYMLDVVDPGQAFSVADYQKAVYWLLGEIRKQNAKSPISILPILVGGTGLYIEAVLDGLDLSITPNPIERRQLEAKPLSVLVEEILTIDPNTLVDLKNKVRVIRAIEIARSGRKPGKIETNLSVLRIGIDMPTDTLYSRINERVKKFPFKKLLAEVSSYPEQLSLYGPAVQDYLHKNISKTELLDKLAQMDRNYARKQMTWLRRDKKIKWLSTYEQAESDVSKFRESQ